MGAAVTHLVQMGGWRPEELPSATADRHSDKTSLASAGNGVGMPGDQKGEKGATGAAGGTRTGPGLGTVGCAAEGPSRSSSARVGSFQTSHILVPETHP